MVTIDLRLRSKDVKNLSGRKFRTGYCSLYHLLRFQERVGYTAGTYGWNYDVYKIDDVIITTGYRGMVGEVIPVEIVRKYEKQAEELVLSYDKDLKYRQTMVRKLLEEFLVEIKSL